MVLVVEDNAEMNRFIAESLHRDYRVERAFGGEEGLRKAVELRPDLILSDIMMPGLSGEDLLREVRRIPSLDPVPVLLLSARADDELRIRLLHEGAQDYLTKPFFAAELRARVANWVAIKRARDVLQSELDTTLDNVEQLARSLATRKKELEAALIAARSAAAEAGAANRAKADFLSVMSHELRTPLNAVLGYLDLLQSGLGGELTELQRRFVDRAKHSSDHLFGLVEQLLTYTRVEAGTERVLNEEIDLRAIVHDVTEMIEPLAAAKGLSLSVVMPDDPVRVQTDPAKVRQILINLVENAVKFTSSGSVSATLEGDTERAVVTVHDTGGGILPEHLGRVFEPFWQADLSKTRIVGGTGLGLTISRRLTELLGGDIQVESEPGAGTTFVVRLPTSPELGWMGGHGGARDRRMGKDRRAMPREGVPDSR
jgi:signal transduction histidine kinase